MGPLCHRLKIALLFAVNLGDRAARKLLRTAFIKVASPPQLQNSETKFLQILIHTGNRARKLTRYIQVQTKVCHLPSQYIGVLILIRIGLNAGKGLHASQNPDRTQVQPASALGARDPDSQTVANDNLRDRCLSFSHRTPVQPVSAVNVGKSLKHDSDYEDDDDDDTSHDDFDDDLEDDLGSLHNLKAPSLRVPQLRSRTNSNFDPQKRAVNLPNRASRQPVPALDAREPGSTGRLIYDPPTPLTDTPHWAQVQPVPAVGVGRSSGDMDVDRDEEEGKHSRLSCHYMS